MTPQDEFSHPIACTVLLRRCRHPAQVFFIEVAGMMIADLEQILAPRDSTRAAWCVFDPDWYQRTYQQAQTGLRDDDASSIRRYYIEHGRRLGHSPNMFFDEAWYLASNPDIAADIEAGDYGSGYEHYCAIGFLNRSPHWLYDDAVYAQHSPDLSDQVLLENDCFNRYDHYLKAGAREGRVAHLLFDPRSYRAHIETVGEGSAAIDDLGPFRHFLHRIWNDRLDAVTTIYFDPVWYRDVQGDAQAALEQGEFVCALHHYLTSPDGIARDPRPEFSESFYRERNPDAVAGIRSGAFGSGYEHFLKTGVFELRDPTPGIDLRRFLDHSPRLRAELAAELCRDAFAYLLRHGPEIESQSPPPAPEPEPELEVRTATTDMLANPITGYGRIDFLGFSTPGQGWIFCGWISPEHPALDTKSTAVAYFEQGNIVGPVLMSSYHREDLRGAGVGVVIFVEGPGRPMGQLMSLNVTSEGATWTLHPAESAAMMRDEALLPQLRPLLGRLRVNAAKAQLVAIAGRRGYTGANTLAELRDRIFLEVDETIFCPPRGVVLVGWMLAGPGVIRTIRLHSGHNEMLLQPEQFLHIERPDVLSSVGAQFGFQDLRCGYMLHVPTGLLPGEATYLAVETERGEVGYRGIPEPKLQGMQAIRFILDRFDQRYEELVRSFEHVAGPAVASLNRQRLRDKGTPEIIDFGVQPDAPVVSIIVPLYGRMDFLEFQFALFSRHNCAMAREFIYVLDDPGKQREVEVLAASVFARFGIPFRLVKLPRNLGYAPANNAGLALARGEYICFMNSDIFPGTLDWMERLVARLRADPDIGTIGPLLLFDDRSVQHMGMVFEPLPEFGDWLFPKHERKGWRPPAQTGLRPCQAITGACMLMARELARELGGFDESFIIGDFEDSDLCMKIAKRGLACVVDLDVTLYHLERQSQAGSEQLWRMNLTLYNAWVHEGRWGTLLRDQAALPPSLALPAAPPPSAPVLEPETRKASERRASRKKAAVP